MSNFAAFLFGVAAGITFCTVVIAVLLFIGLWADSKENITTQPFYAPDEDVSK